jgi:lipopolysaccharide/colanic/teichoic acid biosynthesis glycosyltransferase
MRKKFFYIGKDKKSISDFINVFNGEVEFFKSHEEILKRSHFYRRIPLMLFFYEKNNIYDDLNGISELHRVFPLGHIVLVSDSLSNEERTSYLKSGIQDNISKDFDKERIKQIINFYVTNQNKINKVIENSKTKEIETFVLPLWKRLFDILISSAGLLVLSPLFLIIAAAIRIESKGPIIYKSKRVGSNYMVFDFLKFRSMYSDADKRLKEFSKLNQYQTKETEVQKMEFDDTSILNNEDQVIMVSDDFVLTEEDFMSMQHTKQDNAFVKLEKDPRITKIGAFIRKYSIDELPQLINILKGDMSVVGNRPLPLYEAELLTGDEYIDRFMAPSGLTGLWQVEKRGEAGKLSAEERKNLDIRYAKEFSFWMDIKIILKTFTAFIQKENV